MSLVVAIDGPAGSGKGTIAKEVAERLNLLHVDSGAMYRAITLYAIRNKISLDKLVEELQNIEINQIGKNIILNGEDVTNFIRTEEINKLVSDVSSIQEVREKLVSIQRKMAENTNIIMEGRDIGTVVFPNADVKIYLDGSIEIRAQRRYKEYIEKGIQVSLDEVKENIIQRDKKDKSRKHSPLKMAEDATRIDTTNLTVDQVVNEVVKTIEKKTNI